MSILTEEKLDIFVNDSDNYDDFMNIFHSHSYERVCNNEEDSDMLVASMKILIMQLSQKVHPIDGFDYRRLYSHILRPFFIGKEHLDFLIDDWIFPSESFDNLSNLSVDRLIDEYIIDFAQYMDKIWFIACLNELIECDHIEDSSGTFNSSAIAQFVNEYFFLNEENNDKFIVNLYPPIVFSGDFEFDE